MSYLNENWLRHIESQPIQTIQLLSGSALRVVSPNFSQRHLTREQHEKLLAELLAKQKPKFSALGRVIGLGPGERFNLENERRDHLKGDETAAVLGGSKGIGKAWRALDVGEQTEIVERLLTEEDEVALVAWLGDVRGFDQDGATKMAAVRLPDGYCRLGRRALGRLVPIMMDQGLGYTDAAREAGYHHSDHRPGEVLAALPYYGEALDRHVSGTGDPDHDPETRFGRVANPTVHIGLNQARRLVNRIIGVHGPPDEVVVELARELKLNKEQRDRIRKEQAENQAANDQRRGKLAERNLIDSGENRMRMRLWEELNPDNPLDRRCPYTGEPISIDRLFSNAVEIDHILPFSRTLDNSAANRTVAMRYANKAKGSLSPHEAFGGSPRIAGRGYEWEEILERVAAMPGNKRWRFGEGAMQRFENEERDFLDRQLTDTQYLSRVAREYMTHVCKPECVWVVPGRLTAMLRGWWGLNSILSDANQKDRTDHRHHAIDAAVAALTDRGLLQRISREAARGEAEDRPRLMADTPEPWERFRDDLRDSLADVVVSHRSDHGTEGKLHEQTAYGLVADPDTEDGHNLVYRKPLAALNRNEIKRIRDRDLRARVEAHVEAAGDTRLEDTLRAFGAAENVRRVRLLKKEEGVIGIADRSGRAYKALSPGDNHHVDVLVLPNGTWIGWGVTVFDANRASGGAPPWKKDYPAARHVMRLHKGDLLNLERGGVNQILRVVRLEPVAGRVRLAGHLEGGNLENRHHDSDDPFRWTFASWSRLKERRARKVMVNEIGRVRDSGFRG